MLTLTQTRIKHLLLGLLAIPAISVFVSAALQQSTAHAADYPAGWCSFKQAADQKSLTAACSDDKDNGTFDNVTFKESGKDTFSFTDNYWTLEGGSFPISSKEKPDTPPPLGQSYKEVRCKPAAIKITDNEATISGQYASVNNLSGSVSTWTCTDLLEGKITIDRALVRLTAWRDAFFNSVLEDMTAAECDRFTNKNSQNYKQCAQGVALSVAGCIGSNGSVWVNTMSYADANEQKDAYKASTVECLSGKFTRANNNDIRKAVNQAGTAADENEGKNKDLRGEEGVGEDGPSTTCAIEGMGWLICPAVRIIATFNDALFGMINNLLDINPSLFEREGRGEAIYRAWESMRNIANVAFVIAFMVIIYSQITSAGISNYGIKKLLPRMIIAAILVNLSYLVCALAVDISNIVGMALHDLMIDQAKAMGEDAGANLDMWDGLMTFLLGGAVGTLAIGGAVITAGVFGFMGTLALLIPLAITALIAALTVLFILVAREAFIIILVALSPLAFVAYLLPNTEQWFDRWRKTFVSMLLLYPLVAMLFGGSQLASGVIRAGAEDALTYVLSLVVLVIPLFATPLLLKLSGSLVGRVAGMINNPNKGPFDRMKKAGANYANRRKDLNMEDNIARTSEWRKGSRGSTRLFGGAGSKRRKAATWLSGIGGSNAVDKERESEWAGIASKAAQRDYFTDRAQNDESYRNRMAGGDPKMGRLIESYAIQAKHEETLKDVKAERAKIEHADLSSPAGSQHFLSKMTDESLGAHEMAAHAAEIAARGPGEQFHAAVEASRHIVDDEKRQLVQSQLVSGMREDHFGISDTMRGLMATGKLDASTPVRKSGTGQDFSSIYDSSLDQRLEVKTSAESVVSMKPHDMNATRRLIASGELTDGALKKMVEKMSEAEAVPTIKAKIKGETEQLFIEARKLAEQRGIPLSPVASTGPAPGGRASVTFGSNNNP